MKTTDNQKSTIINDVNIPEVFIEITKKDIDSLGLEETTQSLDELIQSNMIPVNNDEEQ
jgi:hypothetical protein